MSPNKYIPHILVLPEDDAYRQIANGFLLLLAPSAARAIQVLLPAGGWEKVADKFQTDYAAGMSRYAERHVVLLIDFDQDDDDAAQIDARLAQIQEKIPDAIQDRVFVIGVLSEAEDLIKDRLGNFETIGKNLEKDCRSQTMEFWNHRLLKHNKQELARMSHKLAQILFPK